jgi:ATPase subunit of ABC transporter with duplicated ATPase domains
MIEASDVTLRFGEQLLFEEVNIKFLPGNCYGLIGANGSGKSSFLKVLSGEIQPDKGNIHIGKGLRLAMLQQNHFAFDEYRVIDTVIMGHKKLYAVMQERDAIYAKAEFTDEDGLRAGDLETEMADLNGWEAEPEAATLLSGLGVEDQWHYKQMSELEENLKVRVLLAQALFHTPDILLLDEPTNGLDLEAIDWLEEFLYRFPNTVIVVSHDRHFLDKVCTHIADVDYKKIRAYSGNYSFWYEASQLSAQQLKNDKKRREDKIKELQEFVQRFSANAAKSKQATSRKKLIDKLTLEDIPATSRRFPYIDFKSARECGKNILEVQNLSKSIGDEPYLNNISFTVNPEDKIAFVGPFNLAKTTLFKIITGEMEPDSGSFKWGVTITPSHFPKDNRELFDCDLTIVDWLKQYIKDEEDSNVRGFLGRMLFSGDEQLKKVNVLSGGERVRCVLSKVMQNEGNCLVFDEPTNHLDLESITSLNSGMTKFPGVILFNTHDHQLVQTVANRIIEITPGGIIDKMIPFDEYLASDDVKKRRDELYHAHSHIRLVL